MDGQVVRSWPGFDFLMDGRVTGSGLKRRVLVLVAVLRHVGDFRFQPQISTKSLFGNQVLRSSVAPAAESPGPGQISSENRDRQGVGAYSVFFRGIRQGQQPTRHFVVDYL